MPEHPQTQALPGTGRQTTKSKGVWPGEPMSAEDTLKTFNETFSTTQVTEAWAKTDAIVKDHTDDMLTKWSSEIETLLVYSGLSSAILALFNIESYQLLKPGSPDPALTVLQQISTQLGGSALETANADQPAFSSGSSNVITPTPHSAVALNILWFSALVCSLSAASLSLMIKQWIHELRRGLTGNSRENARIRQRRLDSLKKWRVAETVGSLSMLLLLAAVFFFAGLLILLWTLHVTVAVVISAVVAFGPAHHLLVKPMLPIIHDDCCYITPLTHMMFRPAKRALRVFKKVHTAISRAVLTPRTLCIFVEKCSTYYVRYYASPLPLWTWKATPTLHDHERTRVSESADALDCRCVSTAHAASMDPSYLQHSAPPILATLYPPRAIDAVNIVRGVGSTQPAAAWGETVDFWLAAMLNRIHPTVSETSLSPQLLEDIASLYQHIPTLKASPRLLLALSAARVHLGSGFHPLLYEAYGLVLRGEMISSHASRNVAAAMEHSLTELLKRYEALSRWTGEDDCEAIEAIEVLVHCSLHSPATPDANEQVANHGPRRALPRISPTNAEESAGKLLCVQRALSALTVILPTLQHTEEKDMRVLESVASTLDTLNGSAAGAGLVTEELLDALESWLDSVEVDVDVRHAVLVTRLKEAIAMFRTMVDASAPAGDGHHHEDIRL